jgi:hypothetical protein
MGREGYDPPPSWRLALRPASKQPVIEARLGLVFPCEQKVDLDEARVVKGNAFEVGSHDTAFYLEDV